MSQGPSKCCAEWISLGPLWLTSAIVYTLSLGVRGHPSRDDRSPSVGSCWSSGTSGPVSSDRECSPPLFSYILPHFRLFGTLCTRNRVGYFKMFILGTGGHHLPVPGLVLIPVVFTGYSVFFPGFYDTRTYATSLPDRVCLLCNLS